MKADDINQGYSDTQIKAAKKEFFGDKRVNLHVEQANPSFQHAQAILLLKKDGVMPGVTTKIRADKGRNVLVKMEKEFPEGLPIDVPYRNMMRKHYNPELKRNNIPILPKDDFGRRSDLYNEFDKDPSIRAKTDFYRAASDVTNDIAWGAGRSGHFTLPLTIGIHDYIDHGNEYNQHMENISSRLEEMNRGNADIIGSGGTINGVSDADDRDVYNKCMVHLEQGTRGVQGYLNQMEPTERERLIRLSNEQLHSQIINYLSKMRLDYSEEIWPLSIHISGMLLGRILILESKCIERCLAYIK